MQELRDLQRRLPETDTKQVAGELSELPRRIAMARCGRQSCAGLTGSAWLDWLEENDPDAFDWSKRGRVLISTTYAPPYTAGHTGSNKPELATLIEAASRWVHAAHSPQATEAGAHD